MPRRFVVQLFSVPVLMASGFIVPVVAAETTDGKLFTQAAEIAPAAGQAVPEKKEEAVKNPLTEGPAPSWIWGDSPDKKYFVRKTFKGTAQFARLRATCDNSMTLYVNGKKVASSSNWESPVEVDVKQHLTNGENTMETIDMSSRTIAGKLRNRATPSRPLLPRLSRSSMAIRAASLSSAKSIPQPHVTCSICSPDSRSNDSSLFPRKHSVRG